MNLLVILQIPLFLCGLALPLLLKESEVGQADRMCLDQNYALRAAWLKGGGFEPKAPES